MPPKPPRGVDIIPSGMLAIAKVKCGSDVYRLYGPVRSNSHEALADRQCWDEIRGRCGRNVWEAICEAVHTKGFRQKRQAGPGRLHQDLWFSHFAPFLAWLFHVLHRKKK